MKLLKTVVVFYSAVALIPGIYSSFCGPSEFKCLENDTCLPSYCFCNGQYDCFDRSDEIYCGLNGGEKCPSSWWKCKNYGTCIPIEWKCNNEVECPDKSDEEICEHTARETLTASFLSYWGKSSKYPRPGHDNYLRTAVALHLMHTDLLKTVNRHREELISELLADIFTALTMDLKSNELSLTIHALLVTCKDPWNFYGFNLVSELRIRVNRSKHPSPFDLLALCNAQDAMTPKDAQRAADVFVSRRRGFKRDNQAMALLALACIRSRTNFTLNGTSMEAMEQELKSLPIENGTAVKLRTTALVLQALIATQSNLSDFRDKAVKEVIWGAKKTFDGFFGSLSDSYYVAPLLNGATFLNISNSHCSRSKKDSDVIPKIRHRKSSYRMKVQCSLMMDDEKEKTWTLYVPNNSSLFDVTVLINLLGNDLNILYNEADGKPYITSVNNVQEDLERGLYWLTYVRFNNQGPQISELSPADIKIGPSREYILWYKERE